MKLAVALSWLSKILPPACPLCGGTFPAPAADPFCLRCMASVTPLPAAQCLPFAALPRKKRPTFVDVVFRSLPLMLRFTLPAFTRGSCVTLSGALNFISVPILIVPLLACLRLVCQQSLRLICLCPFPYIQHVCASVPIIRPGCLPVNSGVADVYRRPMMCWSSGAPPNRSRPCLRVSGAKICVMHLRSIAMLREKNPSHR